MVRRRQLAFRVTGAGFGVEAQLKTAAVADPQRLLEFRKPGVKDQPHQQAVEHDCDRAGRRPLHKALDRRQTPTQRLVLALASGECKIPVVQVTPRRQRVLTEEFNHRIPLQALDLADVNLAQPVGEVDRSPMGTGQDLCRLPCPGQVAGQNHLDPGSAQPLTEGLGLGPAGLVERQIDVALPAHLGVPRRLPVANQKHPLP